MLQEQQNFVACDYCNASYENERELAIHQFLHTDQDVRMLQSSLNKSDSFKLPKTRKSHQSPKQSIRVSKYYEANLNHQRTYEESLRNHREMQPVPKIRPISEKVQQIVLLSSEYPLQKSTQDAHKKSLPLDSVRNECAKKALFNLQSKQASILEIERLKNLCSNSNNYSISNSQKTASSNSNHLHHKPTNPPRTIGDPYCSRSQKNLHSKIAKAHFVRNSSKSHSSSSLLKSVLKSKITDIAENTTSDLWHFNDSQSAVYFGRTPSELKSILNNKKIDVSQDIRTNLPPSKQNQSSTPKSDVFFRSSSSRGPILCSIKISDWTNIPSDKLTTTKSDSDSNSPFSPKSTVGIAVTGKNLFSHKPIPINNVSNCGLVGDSKFLKTVLTDELRLKWKSSFLEKSAEVPKSSHKDLAKTYFSRLNCVSFSEYPADESKVANENVDYTPSNTSIGL